MYIDGIQDEDSGVLSFFDSIQNRQWFGHNVTVLSSTNHTRFSPQVFSISASSLNRREIKPLMSGGAKVTGEVDRDGNWSIKGEISTSWGESNSNSSGSSNETNDSSSSSQETENNESEQ